MEIKKLGIEQELLQRAHEQQILYYFTDRLYRARALSEVYDAALDAICDGLGCTRASILRFDADDVMRFVAWRGLSERYRLAVDGHSPWRNGDQNAEPICVDDLEGADQTEALKTIILEEGIRALAFVPITIEGKVVGKFMTYYDRSHSFTEHERRLSLTVARQLGFSIERHVADEDVRRLAAIVGSSDDAIFTKGLDGIITSWNPGAANLLGYSEDEVVGRPGAILIPPHLRDEEQAILERIRDGERIQHFDTVRQRKDGGLVDISLTVSPIVDADGTIIGISKIARDITDRRRAQEKQQLLLREMNHRVMNLFAVTSSIVALSALSAPTVGDLARVVRDRLNALARAHSLTVSANDCIQAAAGLRALVETILAPYAGNSIKPRFGIKGCDLVVRDDMIVPVSLLFYEFATNAAKYGALSSPDGRIDLRFALRRNRLAVVWHEIGGPPPAETLQNKEGFGSELIHATTVQLEADLSYKRTPSGLNIRLSIPLNNLLAR